MSKNEFLDQLFGLLSDISPEERDEALAYYREYIEDAGLENEEAILEELGTPEEVATEIKSGIFNKNNQDIDYASNKVKNSPETYSSNNQNNQQENQSSYSSSQYQQANAPQKSSNTALIILAVIAAILLSPVWLGLLGTIFGVVFGFFATIAGLIFGFGFAGLICLFVGVILFFSGFPTILHNPLAGVALIGAGLVVTALGILFLLLTGWFCIGVIPWAIRCISNLVHRCSNRNKEAQV